MPAEKGGESAVLERIASMPGPYRAMGEGLHTVITSSAPSISPRPWYGMPAFAKGGKVVCSFRAGNMSDERYMTPGFDYAANIDDGRMWPTAYGLTDPTPAEEGRIAALVKQAVS